MPNPLINRKVYSNIQKYPGSTIGQIFTDTFDRGSLGANYTTVGSPTITMSGTDMVMSGGAGTYAKYTKYSAYTTCFENWTIVCNFKAVTQAVTTEGTFIGIKTSSAFGNRSVVCSFAHGTGAGSKGKTFILAGTTAPDTYSAALGTSSAQAVVAGDEIRMTITRAGLTLTCLTENITGGTSTTVSYSFPLTVSLATYMHNTGCPFIGTLGGTQNIHDWTFSTTEKKNIKTLVVADSLGHGASASVIGNRWANLVLSSSTNSWAVNSGPGDASASVLAKVNEILLINPKYVLLQAGGNDVRFAVADATRNANYDSFVSQLTAAGITVIHLLAGADSTWDMTAFNTRTLSVYPTAVDCFTPLWSGIGFALNATYDAGDGTHWNNAGHTVNANTVRTAVSYVL